MTGRYMADHLGGPFTHIENRSCRYFNCQPAKEGSMSKPYPVPETPPVEFEITTEYIPLTGDHLKGWKYSLKWAPPGSYNSWSWEHSYGHASRQSAKTQAEIAADRIAKKVGAAETYTYTAKVI